MSTPLEVLMKLQQLEAQRREGQLEAFVKRLDSLYQLALASSPIVEDELLSLNLDTATRRFLTQVRQLVIELKET